MNHSDIENYLELIGEEIDKLDIYPINIKLKKNNKTYNNKKNNNNDIKINEKYDNLGNNDFTPIEIDLNSEGSILQTDKGYNIIYNNSIKENIDKKSKEDTIYLFEDI
jgi:predicted glycosyltransferase involved in capsule biosynthesis